MAVPSAQSSNTISASGDVDLQASGPRAMFGLDAGIRNLTLECMKQYGYQLHNGKFALILHVLSQNPRTSEILPIFSPSLEDPPKTNGASKSMPGS